MTAPVECLMTAPDAGARQSEWWRHAYENTYDQYIALQQDVSQLRMDLLQHWDHQQDLLTNCYRERMRKAVPANDRLLCQFLGEQYVLRTPQAKKDVFVAQFEANNKDVVVPWFASNGLNDFKTRIEAWDNLRLAALIRDASFRGLKPGYMDLRKLADARLLATICCFSLERNTVQLDALLRQMEEMEIRVKECELAELVE
jgi:hypothetical protein